MEFEHAEVASAAAPKTSGKLKEVSSPKVDLGEFGAGATRSNWSNFTEFQHCETDSGVGNLGLWAAKYSRG